MVKTSITLPADILQQVKELSNNVSAVITEALREYLKRQSIDKAVKTFGSWEEREQDSVNIVNELRIDRSYANHID